MDWEQLLGLAEMLGGVADGKLDVVLEPSRVGGTFLDAATLVVWNFSWMTGTVSAQRKHGVISV